MKSLVIIPTLNEEENIFSLLNAVLSLREELDILVVDDHSEDLTSESVLRLKAAEDRVELISNRWPKRGLGLSYKTAFDYCLKKPYDWIISMDADFSHDPCDIPGLLGARDRADWIIGSRYVKGASAQGLNLSRLMISRLANSYIRAKLNMDIMDSTSGFNCFRSSILRTIDFSSIASTGFAFQVEMKYLALKNGVRFTEVPITFGRRSAGASKFSLGVMFEAFNRIKSLEANS